MANLFERILRAGDKRILKRLRSYVSQINALEDSIKELTDEELQSMTDQFRERHEAGESLDDLLPEAFAVVREASQRTLGMRHFDVQLMGAAALHLGNIAEMKTGEGKTLVATAAAYLNAISGKGVHVVTTNDFLANGGDGFTSLTRGTNRVYAPGFDVDYQRIFRRDGKVVKREDFSWRYAPTNKVTCS